MPVVPEAHRDCGRQEEEPAWKRVCVCGVFERGKEVKKKKALRLADQLDRLSVEIDGVWRDANGKRLWRFREALDQAIFHLGCANAELIKEATRKPK